MNLKNNFNHIKIHTQYSICEGALKINELSEFCKEKKIEAVGISDSLNLCGALEFSQEISKLISKGLHSKISIRDVISNKDIESKVQYRMGV